jgi:hypothetical protein
MSAEKIKKMIEDGFSNKKIAILLQLSELEVKQITVQNHWVLSRKIFDSDQIPHIVQLYQEGVSAKTLGHKYGIDKRRVQKWVKEKGILRDKSSSHRFTQFNQNIFDEINTPEKAYWLGFFYADAYNSDTCSTFNVVLKGSDYDHLIKLCNFVDLPSDKITTSIATLNKREYSVCGVRMYSKHLCQKMIQLGCPRAKSFIIKYPDWLNSDYNVHFIRGLFDGDGCLTKRVRYKEWKWSLVSTKECLEVISQIINQNVGFKLNFESISKTGNNTYCMECTGNEKINKLCNWLWQNSTVDMRLDRKYQKYLDLCCQQANRRIGRNNYFLKDQYELHQ